MNMTTEKILNALKLGKPYDSAIAKAFQNPGEIQEVGKGGQNHIFIRVDLEDGIYKLRVVVENDYDPYFALVTIEDKKVIFNFCNEEDGHTQTTINILNGAFRCLINPDKTFLRIEKNGNAWDYTNHRIKPGEMYSPDFVFSD